MASSSSCNVRQLCHNFIQEIGLNVAKRSEASDAWRFVLSQEVRMEAAGRVDERSKLDSLMPTTVVLMMW